MINPRQSNVYNQYLNQQQMSRGGGLGGLINNVGNAFATVNSAQRSRGLKSDFGKMVKGDLSEEEMMIAHPENIQQISALKSHLAKRELEKKSLEIRGQVPDLLARAKETGNFAELEEFGAINADFMNEETISLIKSLPEVEKDRNYNRNAKHANALKLGRSDIVLKQLNEELEALKSVREVSPQMNARYEDVARKIETLEGDGGAELLALNLASENVFLNPKTAKLAVDIKDTEATSTLKTSQAKEIDSNVLTEEGQREEKLNQTKAETKLKVSQADLAKAQATGLPKEIALAEDKLAFNKLELAAKTKAEDAELMGFSDKPTAQDFVATQLAIEENNKSQVIATNLASKVGISDFGGSPTLWVEDFEKFWKGQSDEDIDVLRMELRQMGMLTAFSLKQAGAMSDQEKNDYLSTVPEKGASSKVWSGWLSENHKKSQQAYGALAAKRAFYDKNKTMLKASKDMTLDVGGKPLEVKKGQYIRDIIRKEGVAMSRFAPKTGSTRKDLGSPNLSTPTSTTGTTGNLSTPPAWYQSGGSGKPSWDKY
jgi:hypothetical protein